MKESVNIQCLNVFGIVDTIRLHIGYDKDGSIEEQLNALFLEGKGGNQSRKDQERLK